MAHHAMRPHKPSIARGPWPRIVRSYTTLPPRPSSKHAQPTSIPFFVGSSVILKRTRPSTGRIDKNTAQSASVAAEARSANGQAVRKSTPQTSLTKFAQSRDPRHRKVHSPVGGTLTYLPTYPPTRILRQTPGSHKSVATDCGHTYTTHTFSRSGTTIFSWPGTAIPQSQVAGVGYTRPFK